MVRSGLVVGGKSGVGEVSASLSGSGEPGGAFHAPHGVSKGEGLKWSTIRCQREGDAKGEGVSGSDIHTVEAVGNVAFALADRAVLWVGMDDLLEEAWKAAAKLH